MLILDVKQTPRNRPWEVTVVAREETFVEDRFWPCFYILVDERYARQVMAKVLDVTRVHLMRRASQLEQAGLTGDPEEYVIVEEVPDMTPLLFDETSLRYVRPIDDPKYKYYRVYRVKVPIPRVVAEAAQELMRLRNQEPILQHMRLSEFNIRYICNVTLKMPYMILFGVPPVYTRTVDPALLENAMSKITILSYDCEFIDEGGKKYIAVGYRFETLTCEEDLDEADKRGDIGIEVLELDSNGFVKSEKALDNVRYVFEHSRMIVDYNGTEYDRKLLIQYGVLDENYFYEVACVDMYLFIQRNASAYGVGEMSKGLQDVAATLGRKYGFKEEWIRIKQRKDEYLKHLDKAVSIYLKNDVKLNTALARIVVRNLVATSAAFKMPLTALIDLPSGLIYEYTSVKMAECFGYIPEAKPVFDDPRVAALFTAMKVFHYKLLIDFLNKWGEKLRKLLSEGKINEYYKILREAAKDFVAYAKYAELQKKKKSSESLDPRVKIAETYFPKPSVLPPRVEDEEWHAFYIDCEKRKSDISRIQAKLIQEDCEIEASDFAMTYPTYAIVNQIDPCAFDLEETCRKIGVRLDEPDLLLKIAARAEDAVFNVRKFIAPFYAYLLILYKLRGTYKKLAKELKKVNSQLALIYDLLQEALKRVINSYFGAAGKKSGVSHAAHPMVALKIFHGTLECLGCVFLDAYARGWIPIYGDTDSVYFIVPAKLAKEEPTKTLNETVSRLYGMKLDYKARFRKFVHYRPKSYVGIGDELMVKGKILIDMKVVVPQPLRPIFLKCLSEGRIQPLLEELESLESVDEILPSRSVRFLDMFVMNVMSIKSKRRELEKDVHKALSKLEEESEEAEGEEGEVDVESEYEKEELKQELEEMLHNTRKVFLARGYIQALYYEPAIGDYVRSFFKKVKPTHPIVLPRLVGMAIRYGVKERRGVYVVDYTKISITDIADIRALILPETTEKLSGSIVIVSDSHGNVYRAVVNPETCKMIVADRYDNEYVLYMPYDKVVSRAILRKAKSPVDRLRIYQKIYSEIYGIDLEEAYELNRVEIGVDILSKATLDDAIRAVEYALYVYLVSKGLDKIFRDFDILYDKVKSYLPRRDEKSTRKVGDITEYLTYGEAV